MTWRQYGGSFDNPINPEYEQEARLVEQSRAGSERAFSALLARYQQPVFRLILYLVGDEEEARELTRISIKNALLHMPSVPSGYSIRPWLLRVAVLVALDAVRERGQTPEDLLLSVQLPAPAGPPRIVDADPADSETMSLKVAEINAARQHETALADPWEELPLETERELIRLLLAGLPEGDAELLALGVVGQVPTRDLSALAGTSQRSVRRRIARALILFQSRYNSVRTEALPEAKAPKPEPKELPPSRTTATPSSPLVERARKGLADATELVRRGLQSVRQGMGVADAEERLRALRTSEVPPADIVPPSPDIPPASDLDSGVPYQPFSQADVEAPETGPLPDTSPEEVPPGTFAPQSTAGWTAAATSDMVEHDTIPAPPVAAIPDQDTMQLPPPTRASYGATPQAVDQVTDAAMTVPAPGAEDMTAIRPPEPGSSPSGRQLPRFGPPPEEVLVGMPPTLVPGSEPPEAPSASDEPVGSFAPPAEPQPSHAELPPEATTAMSASDINVDNTAAAAESAEPTTVPRSGWWDDVTLVNPARFGEPEAVAEPAATEIPAEAVSIPEPDAADLPAASATAVEALSAEPMPDHEEQPASVVESVEDAQAPHVTELSPPVAEAAVPAGTSDAFSVELPPEPEPAAAEPGEPASVMDEAAPLTVPDVTASEESQDAAPREEEQVPSPATGVAMQQGTDLAAVSSAATLNEQTDEEITATNAVPQEVPTAGMAAVPPEAPAPAHEAVTEDNEIFSISGAAPSEQAAEDAEPATEREAGAEVEPPAETSASAEPPTVIAIERAQGKDERPQQPITSAMGSTSVLSPSARDDYMSRHRPPWLDAGDMSSIPGVRIDPAAIAEEDTVLLPPAAPASGALTLPAHEAFPPNAAETDAVPVDMADLADLTAPPADDAAESPADTQAPKRLRTPSRPMPKLERDIIDPPHER